jgi:hypothetical protein
MELTHAQLWGEMLRKHQGMEPEVLFGDNLQVEFKFQSNKDYVRRVLDKQRDLRLADHAWAHEDQLPKDWPSYRYRQIVNADGVPSEEIVDAQQSDTGRPGDELLARARKMAVDLRKAS